MRRFWLLVLPTAALIGGCTIEETPQQYIDHLTTPAAEIQAAQDELMARLLSLAPGLQRGDRISVIGALSPAPDVVVIGPRTAQELTSPGAVVDTMISLANGSAVRAGGSTVSVGPNNRVAWFRSLYEFSGGESGELELIFSGVFIREEGAWRLTQGHLSSVVSQSPPPADQDEPTPGAE